MRVFGALGQQQQSTELLVGMKIDDDDDGRHSKNFIRTTLIIWPEVVCTHPGAVHVMLCPPPPWRTTDGFLCSVRAIGILYLCIYTATTAEAEAEAAAVGAESVSARRLQTAR